MRVVSGQGNAGFSPRRRALLGLAGGGVASMAQAQAVPSAADAQRAANREGFETVTIPVYSQDIMNVVNLHEFEDVGRRKISELAYNYIRAGAADELTLKANRAAFADYWVRRKVMVDVSRVDTAVELFGKTYPHPVLLGPVGLRRLMHPDGDRLTILAAHKSGAILVGPRHGLIADMTKAGTMPVWWASSLGYHTQADAERWAKTNEDLGAAALCVSLDYPYTGARDRPSRDHWEAQWSETPRYNTGDGGSVQFQPGMIFPYYPRMNWDWLKWVRGASKLPLVIKGITTGEDAKRAVAAGADAISVSNHGGRTLDGAIATLHALPEVVDAVGPKIPVLVDGGVRRGGDVVKAAALGARAIMIGRPYLWGLAAFGQEGVQRVIEVLEGETRIALALSGAGTMRGVDRSFIRPAWKAYKPG